MRIDDSTAIRGASCFALLLSGGLHAAVVLGITAYNAVPQLDIEFTMPTEVEFGLTDEASATLSGESTPALPAQDEQQAESPETRDDELSAEEQARRAQEQQKRAEAQKRRREEARKRREEAARRRQEARDEQLAKHRETADEEVRLPAGAQIALRLDMARVRASPLKGSVSRLLAEIPDWHMMLNGSDINPVEQLDHVMVASANLQRGSWLVAGRVSTDTEMIVPITNKMASARNKSTSWSTAHGVRTAPWHDDQGTDHVVAIWDGKHFSITRPEDLPRLMAVASALSQADAEQVVVGPTELAETLMKMAQNEAIRVDIEGARRFARAQAHVVPKSLHLSVLEVENGALLSARATFDSVSQAQQGLAYWKGLRDQYAAKTIVRAMGYGRLLDGIEFEQQGTAVLARSQITYREIETILGFVENWLRTRNRQIQQRQEAVERAKEHAPSTP